MAGWRKRLASRKGNDSAQRTTQERELFHALENDVRAGAAVAASQEPTLGPPLVRILQDLLRHPLCKGLRPPPALFIHYDPQARLGTFGNVILVPFGVIAADQMSDARHLTALKGGIAHELAHIICGDFRRLAENPTLGMTTDMESRADLIAAHLCGDGGVSLADWLTYHRNLESFARDAFPHQPVEAYVTEQKDRYPSLDKRITNLRRWSEALACGTPLPHVSLGSLMPKELDIKRGGKTR